MAFHALLGIQFNNGLGTDTACLNYLYYPQDPTGRYMGGFLNDINSLMVVTSILDRYSCVGSLWHLEVTLHDTKCNGMFQVIEGEVSMIQKLK